MLTAARPLRCSPGVGRAGLVANELINPDMLILLAIKAHQDARPVATPSATPNLQLRIAVEWSKEPSANVLAVKGDRSARLRAHCVLQHRATTATGRADYWIVRHANRNTE